MNPKVDIYLKEGCGRCEYWKTPKCKTLRWQNELKYLRNLLLNSELIEDVKWGVPCYTLNNKNVILLSAFKEFCSLGFFKGVLIKDVNNLLTAPGENSQSVRQFRFTNLEDIKRYDSDIKSFIDQAIEIEKSGLEIEKISNIVIINELQDIFDNDPNFKQAFEALTPGRQRGYTIYFSTAKQSQTRISRIEKSIPRIMEGLGLHD